MLCAIQKTYQLGLANYSAFTTMSKRDNEFKIIEKLSDNYRKMSDEQLIKISQGYSFSWDVKYKKALNIVLNERGLKGID
jgi:hypothetical protein